MSAEMFQGLSVTFTFKDATNSRPLIGYSPVSFASADEDVTMPTIGNVLGGTGNANTTYLVGVTLGWAQHGQQVSVLVDGWVRVLAGGNITRGQMVYAISAATNGNFSGSSGLEPFSNMKGVLMPKNLHPEYGSSVSFNYLKVGVPSFTLSGSQVLVYPLGVAMESGADGQYIRVKIDNRPMYAGAG